jgi:hypothetical protein
VDEHGAGHAQDMLPQFEAHLESRSNGGAGGGGDDADDEEAHDRVREGVVVLLGTLARHMDPADPKAWIPAPSTCSRRQQPIALGNRLVYSG